MAEEGNMEQNNTPRKSPKKKLDTSKALPISAIALSVIALLGSGMNLFAITSVDTEANNKATWLKGQIGQLTDRIAIIENSGNSNEEILAQVKGNIENTIKASEQKLTVLINGKVNQAKDELRNEINIIPTASVNTPSSVSEQKVKEMVEQLTQPINQRVQSLMIESRTEDSALRTLINSFNAEINSLKKQEVASTTPQLQRLKEFNIINVLKDGTLFVVDAPLKNGKENTITLVVGESFRSKLGAHKVLKIEKASDDTYRLVISGGYFIDTTRQEFTTEELKTISAQQQAANKVKTKTPAPRVVAQRVTPNKAENKIMLSGWRIITTLPQDKKVVAFNPETNRPVNLTENEYINGIGTVRSINYETGETCFEQYCIAGLKR
ncbi:hypothetical protein QTV44_002585 [Vibrio vulnificus]|nr:hypothetical protein [Vibrio vulnificus]